MFKSNRGITLVVLITTLMILAILVSVTTFGTINLLSYSSENIFMTQLKVIREKVAIVSKEIELGSTAYDEIGTDLSELSSGKKAEYQNLLLQYGVPSSSLSEYRYFEKEDLELLGVKNIERKVLINLSRIDVISVESVVVDGVYKYTLDERVNPYDNFES